MSTNTTEAGVVAHALTALAEHVAYRAVTAPHTIFINADYLQVCVSGADDLAERWAVSLVNGDGVRCAQVRDGYAHFETRGLLPDSNVRVVVTWVRPATVQSVPA